MSNNKRQKSKIIIEKEFHCDPSNRLPSRCDVTFYLPVKDFYIESSKKVLDETLSSGWGSLCEFEGYRSKTIMLDDLNWDDLEDKIERKENEVRENLQEIIKENEILFKNMPISHTTTFFV